MTATTTTPVREHYALTGLTRRIKSAVAGVDLSPGFIDAATHLTARCALSERVTCDALHVPFEEGAFDAVFLQHVAMNVEDRGVLYAEGRVC
jgi:hypothetical protein